MRQGHYYDKESRASIFRPPSTPGYGKDIEFPSSLGTKRYRITHEEEDAQKMTTRTLLFTIANCYRDRK